MELAFEVIIRDGEDGWLIGECPELPGCMSQGKSPDECLQNLAEAIVLWIEVQLDKKKRETAVCAAVGPGVKREVIKFSLAGAV